MRPLVDVAHEHFEQLLAEHQLLDALRVLRSESMLIVGDDQRFETLICEALEMAEAPRCSFFEVAFLLQVAGLRAGEVSGRWLDAAREATRRAWAELESELAEEEGDDDAF